MLGFARLVEFDTAGAREAFARAIAFVSADPLPHLGQGLASIRDGELAAGRADLEVAAGLDPNNALIRSYLGKAYFEERRAPLDAQQLAIAKELDPLDPTPYLYDAIREQTENQPVEALDDLQTSIRLNDNRAVYRSRLQLDQDRAARGTSLARIYDDLGFYDVAVQEAARSVARDPTQPAAHRFLSDALIGVRRTEVARVSELLQAQMLQDININPVQPSLSEVVPIRLAQLPLHVVLSRMGWRTRVRAGFARALAEVQSRFATEAPGRRSLVTAGRTGTGVRNVRTPRRTGWARAPHLQDVVC